MTGLRRPRVRAVQQMEAAECGVACLAMIASYHDNHVSMAEARELCGTSRDGNSAVDLLRGAGRLGLEGRGVCAGLNALGKLRTPAILHWELNHFVVLERARKRTLELVDPARGRRTVDMSEVDRCFSGVALEFSPTKALRRQPRRSPSHERYVAALRKAKRPLAFVILANLTAQVLALALPASTQVLIDHVILPRRAEWVIPVLALGVLGTVGQIVIMQLRGASQALLHGTLGLELGTELGRRLLSLPLPFLDGRSHGDLLGRVQLQNELRGMVARTAQAGFDLLLVLLMGALMLAYDLPLGLLAAAVMIVRIAMVRRLRAAAEQSASAELAARGREKATLVEATTSPEMVKGLELESALRGRYERRVIERAACTVRSGHLQNGLSFALALVGAAMEAGILCYGGGRVISGQMTVGVFSGFIALRAMVEAPLGALVSLVESWSQARGALERSDDVLCVSPVGNGAARADCVAGRIELRGVGFRYGSGGAWVLRGVDLTISAGERVVIIGPSGHGKSTLAKLMCGLIEPSEGEVLLDGQPIQSYERRSLAARLGVVLQDPLILEGTLREAICLRIPDAEPELVEAAVRAACLEEVVERLPGSYEGKVLAQGTNLSGGERQRLALAQALLGEPRLLLLDEATSCLDEVTERRVLDNLQRATATVISVVHRPAALDHAGRIVAVAGGAVRELDVAQVRELARSSAAAGGAAERIGGGAPA